MNSSKGDPAGSGATKFLDQSNATIISQYANPGLHLWLGDTGGSSWFLDFQCPADGPLVVGTYQVDTASVDRPNLNEPYFFVRESGMGIYRIRGQFEVKKMIYSANGGVSLWITFTQYVNGSAAALTGELKIEADADYAPINMRPRVYGGLDRSVALGKAIPFKAVVQDDGLPSGTLSVKWEASKASNPGPMLISAPEATETTVTFMSEGNYKLKVTASDGELSYLHEINVSVVPPEDFSLLRIQLPTPTAGEPAGLIELHGSHATFEGTTEYYAGSVHMEVQEVGARSDEKWVLAFGFPDKTRPAPGTYTVGKNVPGTMQVTIARGTPSPYIPVIGGSVQVLAAQYTENGSPSTFHALFALYTDESASPIMGEIRYRVNPGLTDTKPLVTAGIDQALTTLEPAVLRGGVLFRGSTTSPLAMGWSKISGPGEAVFSDPAALVTPVAFSEPGTYVLRLNVADESGVHSDEVQITELGYEISIATKSIYRSGTDYYFPPRHKITAWVSGDTLQFEAVEKSSGNRANFIFNIPPGQSFAPGVYQTKDGQNSPNRMYVPGWSTGLGQFEILEIEVDDNGTLVSAWVRYRRNMNDLYDGPAYTEGEIRFRTVSTESAANRAPLVNLGPDLMTSEYHQRLTASVADDLRPFGRELEYSWKLLSGPGEVSFSTPLEAQTEAYFSAPGVYRLLFSVSDGEFTSSDELVVVFKSAKRSYEGLVTVGNAIVGRVVINLSAGNAFTARIQVGQTISNVKGDLSTGYWYRSGTNSRGQEITTTFYLDTSGEKVSGEISVDEETVTLSAGQTYGSFQRASGLKCPYSGRYTHILLASSGVPITGAGYGDIVIQPSGAYRFKGTLADGVPFTAGGNLSISGAFDLFMRLRNGHEHVAGSASFAEGGEELAGSLGWYREASVQERLYPDGLSLALLVRGSRYQAPPKGSTLFPPATRATAVLDLHDLSFPVPIAPQLTFSGQQLQITGAPAGFDVKFDAKTGYFKGTFKGPVDLAVRRFGGVILQGLKVGAGYFLSEDHSGSVSLQVANDGNLTQ